MSANICAASCSCFFCSNRYLLSFSRCRLLTKDPNKSRPLSRTFSFEVRYDWGYRDQKEIEGY
jgi:hypothetical protein